MYVVRTLFLFLFLQFHFAKKKKKTHTYIRILLFIYVGKKKIKIIIERAIITLIYILEMPRSLKKEKKTVQLHFMCPSNNLSVRFRMIKE